MDELYTKLIRIRHQVAVNAGFGNFRDHIRSSHMACLITPRIVLIFTSISSEVVPLLEELMKSARPG